MNMLKNQEQELKFNKRHSIIGFIFKCFSVILMSISLIAVLLTTSCSGVNANDITAPEEDIKEIKENIKENIKEDKEKDKHYWTQLSDGLIAHALGGILDLVGSNCYEALITSYRNGHRVFEIDICTTSDGKLALTHNWHQHDGIMTAEEWKEKKIADVFQSLFIEDIFEYMTEHTDMYIVTDTKDFQLGIWDETGGELMRRQIQTLVDAALEIDPELLNRVVPQVYNQEFYDIVMDIYPFDSVIYTLYASPDSDDEVVEFVAKHDNIKVVTMGPVRYSEKFYNDLTEIDKLVYFFTLNDEEEVNEYREMGIHGFYTDFIYPSQISN